MPFIKIKTPLDISCITNEDWTRIDAIYFNKLAPYRNMLRPMQMEVNYSAIAENLSQDIYNIAINHCNISVRKTKEFQSHRSSTHLLDRVRISVNEARRAMRQSPTPENRVGFFTALRALKKIKGIHQRQQAAKSQSYHEKQFRKSPWNYVKKNVQQTSAGQKQPSDPSKILEHFRKVYAAPTEQIILHELPTNTQPNIQFDNSGIKPKDIRNVLKKAKATSSPGPDGIPYGLFKRLPAVQHVMATLFNRLLEKTQVPPSWQQGCITLIHKSGDPDEPANYRPIALTSTVAKTFHSVIARRILKFSTDNDIIDQSMQKGFLRNLMGCTDHSILLQSIIKHAKRTKHTLHCL